MFRFLFLIFTYIFSAPLPSSEDQKEEEEEEEEEQVIISDDHVPEDDHVSQEVDMSLLGRLAPSRGDKRPAVAPLESARGKRPKK